MVKIDYVMYAGKLPEQRRRKRIEVITSETEEIRFRLHLVPEQWRDNPKKAKRRIEKHLEEMEISDACGEAVFSFLPDVDKTQELAGLMWKESDFRQQAVLVLPEGEAMEEELLRDNYENLNGLYVTGGNKETVWEMFEWIYEETGLTGVWAEQLPELQKRDTIVIDMQKNFRIPWRRLPEKCIYLDMTDSPEKEYILRTKRPDISIATARNYLDTKGKEMYNAICLRKVERRSVLAAFKRV